ncbi:MAG: family 20 glycosylhydrolase [Chloroflexia bacterium]|nr:family 20 glycosylhydrolase [Chloroflexia bacterium]
MNKFHFHICDDEGWRVEIPGLPELTEYGAWRGYSKNEEKYLWPSFGSGPIADEKVSHGCGFYTREDFIEIVKYASARNIEIIPEVDMPGHARAAIKSMEKRYQKLMAENKENEAKEYLLTDFEDKSEYQSVQGWTDNVINVGMESSYNFLTKVTDELVKMFKDAGVELKCIHTGGDEVPAGIWSKSPECDKVLKENKEYSKPLDLGRYFIRRFSKILADRNITAGGWEEIGLLHGTEIHPNPEFVGQNIRTYVWNNMWNSGAEDIGYQLANAGYPVVLANVTNLYFDLAYHKHPKEPGYYWGNFIDTRKAWEYTPMDLSKCAEFDRFGQPVNSENVIRKENHLTRKGEANVLGIQGLLWSENNLGLERLEYFMFPKLLGLAERAWAEQPSWVKKNNSEKGKQQKEATWNEFVNTAGQRDFKRMDYMNKGIGYRVATPGAKIIDGMLHANIRYPGLIIRYTTNGEEPTVNSPEYKAPVKVSGAVKLKVFTSNGRGSRTVEVK